MAEKIIVDEKANWNPQQHYKTADVARRYDEERFSGLRGKLYIVLEKRALKKAFADVPHGSTIVDLPTGTGRIAEILLEEGYNVVGMDVSPAMLDVAKDRLTRFGDRFSTQVVDAFALESSSQEPEGKFDAALCARVLMHFPVEVQSDFLNGVKKLTDGPILFTQSYVTPYQRMRQFAKKLLGVRSQVMHPLTPADMGKVVSGAGLKLQRKHWVAAAVSEAVIFVCRKEGA